MKQDDHTEYVIFFVAAHSLYKAKLDWLKPLSTTCQAQDTVLSSEAGAIFASLYWDLSDTISTLPFHLTMPLR